MPHCSIGVDVIVGFPGETEEYFMETVNFLKSLPVSYLHVFSYSERNNNDFVNMSYSKNHEYDYMTIYTNGMTTKKLQNTIKNNIINGWELFTISDLYVTMQRKCNNFIK